MFKYFPVTISQDRRKIPLIKNWERDATDNPDQHKLWTELFNGRLNLWGIPTGYKSDLLVLDVDIKTANGFNTLQQHSLAIPDTMWQRTISGGAHYFFKYPKDGKRYGNKVNFLPGLDCRGEGGYVAYYGQLQGSFIAEAPQWFLEHVGKKVIEHTGSVVSVSPNIVQDVVLNALTAVREAPAGESNNTLNTESFKMGQLVASGGVSREYAEQVLFEAAMDRGKPASEARATIKSGIDGGLVKPLTVPENLNNFPQPVVQQTSRWTPRYFTKSDLLNTRKLRKPQLFKDWSSEDIHITTADGGTGKTTLKLYEAICLALGQPFLGFEAKQQGKTLIITGEDTQEKLGAMIGQIMKQMGLLNGEHEAEVKTVLESILVKKEADMCIVIKDKQGFLYPNPSALEQVMQAVDDIKPKMIVFDPISSFWGSEAALNDMAKAVNKFMSYLVERSNASVEMINHMGKMSSNNKDMTQFAGRGGTGLPSNSRVSKVFRPVFDEEFINLTGREFEENESAMMCNVNKFSDGSPLLNKPFMVIRKGYLFSRVTLKPEAEKEEIDSQSDSEKIFNFILSERKEGKYPTKGVVIAYFMSSGDRITKARIDRGFNYLLYQGHGGHKIKLVDNPDAMIKEKAAIVTDREGNEVI